MPFADNFLAWHAANRGKVLRYTYIAQVVTGLFLLLFGYTIGKEHLRLVRFGLRAPGTVVDFQRQQFRDSSRTSSSTHTGFMPVVQFQAADRVIRFKDWLGSSSAGPLHQSVIVLYDPVHPTSAMIDRQVMNWIPWGPTIGVGAFLILVGTIGLVHSARSMEPSPIDALL